MLIRVSNKHFNRAVGMGGVVRRAIDTNLVEGERKKNRDGFFWLIDD